MNLSRTYTGKPDAADRRRLPRTIFESEILVLDPASGRVRRVLVGSDLSAHGVRVEPHQDLALGERLRLAFFEPGQADPLMVTAEAVRDDGSLGWLLAFRELDRATQARIQRLMRRLPAMESFGSPPADDPGGLAFARIQPKSVLG